MKSGGWKRENGELQAGSSRCDDRSAQRANPAAPAAWCKRFGGWVLALGLAANPGLHAATRASTNYSISAETLDGGGHAASSANYSTVSSVEVTTIGNSTSANHTLHHGFIQRDETAPANLPPIVMDDDVAVDEDSPLVVAAPGVLANDSDPDGDGLTAAVVSGPSSGQLTLNADGSFSYTPDSNFNGADRFTYQASDGTLSSVAAAVTIAVNPVNDLPVFTLGGDVTVDEDSGAYSAAQATGIDDGDPEVEQTLAFNVSNDNNALFSVQPAIAADGTLTFTPAANSNGVALVTVSLSDDDTAGGDALTTAGQTFTITVKSVNDWLVFTLAGDVTVDEDSGAYSAAQATGIDDGDPEVDQTLTFHVSNNNNHLFSVRTALAADGTLTFTPAANSNGVALVTVSLSDDNTAGGEALTTADQTFTITVNAVDDAPVMTLSGTSQSVQYSDSMADLTITVEDIDSDVSSLTLSTSGLPDDLKLSKSASWTLDGTAKASWTLSGQVLVGAGEYDITFTAQDGTADSDSQTFTLTVLPEGTVVYFDENNPVAQPVATPGGNSGGFSLTFYVVEEWPDQPNDGSQQYGDLNKIAGADVTVSLVPVGQGSSVSGACSLQPVAGTGYDQVLEVQCAFDDVPVNT
jgi:VCBS repeat-containing protein